MRNRPPRLSEAVDERLRQMRDVFTSGLSEETGRLIRDPETRQITGRIRGVKPAFPELKYEKAGPKSIAAALAKGKGKLYRRVEQTVRADLGRRYSDPKQRLRRQGSVGPHERITAKCQTCGEYHGKGKHASHGEGSFHRTHLFAFNPPGATMKWKRCTVCGAPVRGASMHAGCKLKSVKPRVSTTRTTTVVRSVKNPQGSTLLGSRTVAVVYERFKGHKCNAACKRANHQYIHRFKRGTPTPLSVSADRKTVTIGKRH